MIRKGFLTRNCDKISMAFIFSMVVINTGCCVNLPWKKSPPTTMETAIAGAEVDITNRGWAEQAVYYENIGIQHRPLYFSVYNEYVKSPTFTKKKKVQEQFDAVMERLSFNVDMLLLPISMYKDKPITSQISRSNLPVQPLAFEIPEN
ncbi:MAG: hypothetical protein JEZ07_17190 [Phycisphaerae bacterium]|nr:hypothetical protein [Phycisphaerae bacterium]